jgi:UV DNA damage endonuclease
MRLGFVAKSVAHPELKSHDGRRWQNSPHLSVSLAYLRDMLAYVIRSGIGMYRMTSELAPYMTHPDMPQFHGQVAECARELDSVGEMARAGGVRLSFHPAQHVLLNSPNPALVCHSVADVMSQAEILDAMGMGPEAVVIAHLGGLYGDRHAARERFVRTYRALPEPAQRRLCLENDDTRFAVDDILWVHGQTGVRVVFDNLHHRLNNPADIPLLDALAACLATWPADVRPKIHFSSPRTELNVEKQPGKAEPLIRPPQWRNHADYAHPFEFIELLRLAQGSRPFDVMLEVKAKDVALLQLRRDLARFAPELAAQLEPPLPASVLVQAAAAEGDLPYEEGPE